MAAEDFDTPRERRKRLARQRTEPPTNYWRAGDDDITIGNELFRVRGWHRGTRVLLDDNLDSATWEFTRQDRVFGSVTLRRPASDHQLLGVGMGDWIALEYKRPHWEEWRRVWRMLVFEPERDPVNGTATCGLRDGLSYLARGQDEWAFKRNKKHPGGWLPLGVVRVVARRRGIRLGKVYRGRYRIKKLVRQRASALDILRAAYKLERRRSGRRFTISMIDGPLTIRPLVRSPSLLKLGPLIIEAAVREHMHANMATILTARATAGSKKRKKKKIVVTVRSPALIRRYGKIHRTITVEADSRAEARREARRELANRGEPVREVTLTHPGIPGIRRGHALRLHFPQEHLRQIVFVSEIRHEATPGSYNMHITCRFDDPYLDAEEERSHALRCAAARRHDRPVPDGCPESEKPKPPSGNRRAEVTDMAEVFWTNPPELRQA